MNFQSHHHACPFYLGSKHILLNWHSRSFHSDLHYLCLLISCCISSHFPVNHGFIRAPSSFILSFTSLLYAFCPGLCFTLLMSGKLNLIFQDRIQMQVKTLKYCLAHDKISINISHLLLLNKFLLHFTLIHFLLLG